MGAKTRLREWFGRHDGITGAVAVCALGRALDFATTWVTLGQGRAMERAPLATHAFGNGSADRPAGTALGERMFFVSIGVISVIGAAFNTQYLM